MKEETPKDFFIYIVYDLEKKNEDDPAYYLKREMTLKFTLQALNPFIMRTRAKILNHYYNNMYKMENIGGKAAHLLIPVNQKCNILFYLTPPSENFKFLLIICI